MILIVGQGLAGTVLGLTLEQRGAPFSLIDPGETITSSRVAAGLISPVTGGRVTTDPNFPAMFDLAKSFYGEFLDPLRIVRLWANSNQREIWEKRRALRDYARHVLPEAPPDPTWYEAKFGGAVFAGGRLRIGEFLDRHRERWMAAGRLRQGVLRAEDIDLDQQKAVVFCNGAAAADMPWFSWAPWRNAAGDVLELECPDEMDERLVNGGKWMLPLGGNRVLAGATHNEPLSAIEDGLRRFYKGRWTVTAHRAAVRPVFKGTRVLMGEHPGRPGIWMFNGLGSKGGVKAPWHARILVDAMLDGKPLPEDSDIKGRHA